MIDRDNYGLQNYTHKSSAIDQSVQNSLKKLKIFQSATAVQLPSKAPTPKPKSIMKPAAIPSV